MSGRRLPAPNGQASRPRSAASRPLSVSQVVGPSDRKVSREEIPATNIQVAIRCRRRSAREIEEKSAAVVSVNEASGNEVTVELAATTSTFGVVSLPPTRTYPFDKVFGPDADQATVYQSVVAPMLNEVLQGYNCTLFAYGQTGTGKTYTMQGDLQLTPLGNPVANGGMMPRVLINLFQALEEGASDFSVKISYLELYNEELRDLLADSSENSESTSEANQPLKIYDDAKKGGVFVQGIEEVPVKSAAHAISQLSKGSHRRQVAATKFNDHSSRSHAIFTITVHMKERTAIGDDVLRVGKFNLVDLAGSENIGRSGAENKRAREAGMINQSLLTLGRVITALVEKSPHVPYRESKLTRLLQDSLGGKTKTKLIATVSPARCNVEETLSTLEYALSAKSIHNRPEMNQRMSRNALLKDYIAEIERLKADLVSARERNGMFLSSETWDQLSAEKEQMQLECEGAKRRCDEITSQMNALREEFEQSMAMLVQRDTELAVTKSNLETRTAELRSCEKTLVSTEKALEEEIIVGQAYHSSENALDGIAHGLQKTVVEAVGDLDGLFFKLDHKSAQIEKMLGVIAKEAKSIDSKQNGIASQLAALLPIHSQYLAEFGQSLSETISFGKQFLASHSKKLGDSRQALDRFVQEMQMSEDKFLSESQALQSAIYGSIDQSEALFDSLAKDLNHQSNVTIECIGGVASTSGKIMCDAVENLAELTRTVVLVVAQALEEQEKRRLADLQEQKEQADFEIGRLKAQNASLQSLVQKQHQGWATAQGVLLQQIGELVSQFSEQRQEEFSSISRQVQVDNELTRTNYLDSVKKRQGLNNRQSTETQKLQDWLQTKKAHCDQSSTSATEQIQTLNVEIASSSKAAQSQYSLKREEAVLKLHATSESSKEAFDSGFDRMRSAKRARLDETTKLTARLVRNEEEIKGLTTKLTDHSMAHANTLNISLGNLRNSLSEFSVGCSGDLESISQSASRILGTCSTPDQPTGSTPRKRKWQYASGWKTAGSREAILRGHRHRDNRIVGNSQPPGENLDACDSESSTPYQSPRPGSDAESLSPPTATPAVSPGKGRPRKGLKNRTINTVGLGPHKKTSPRQTPFFSGGR